MIRLAAIAACVCTALAATPFATFAQSVIDARVCENTSLTKVPGLTDSFASLSWRLATSPQDKTDLMVNAIFLGNVKGNKPDTWQSFLDQTMALVSETQQSGAIYGLGDLGLSLVSVGLNSANNRVCILASDVSYMTELIRDYPDAQVVQDGPRTWFYNETPEITILASEFPSDRRPGINLPRDAIFTVTYRLNGREAAGVEK